jgi:hypothetical protein
VNRVTFAIAGPHHLTAGGELTRVARKPLEAGDYVVVATVNSTVSASGGDNVRDLVCELHADPGAVIGSASDRRLIPDGQFIRRSLTLNGGAHFPDGGTITLFCGSQSGQAETVDGAQLMITQIDGFF